MTIRPQKCIAKATVKVPGICLLVLRICRLPKKPCLSLTSKIAFWLLLTNVPIGIGGAALCVLLHGLSGKITYLWTGTAIYVSSWLMLALGVGLAGKELANEISANARRKIAAWKRFRKKLRQNCATSV